MKAGGTGHGWSRNSRWAGSAALVLCGVAGLSGALVHPLGAQLPAQLPAQSPVHPTSAVDMSGMVLSSADSSAVVGAEFRNTQQQLLGRSDQDGHFSIAVRPGDTVRVRVLGFRMRTLVVNVNVNVNVNTRTNTVYLDAMPTSLPVVITTAGQREMRVADATHSVMVLDRKQIDAVAAIAVNQLVRNLPGFQEIPSPPSRTSISIRGLNDARVLVLVDGEPTAGALIDNRDIGRMSTLAVERVEVTKGPSSVEFGSDALGGVINLVTAPPTQALTVNANVRGGALGRRESTLGVSETFGKVGVRLDGGWRQVDRLTSSNAEGSTLERVYDVRSDVRYALSEQTQLKVNAEGTRERQRWPVGGGYNGFVDNRSVQGLAEIEQKLAGGSLRARGFVQEYRYQFRQAQALVPIAGSADSLEQQERLRRAMVSYTRDMAQHRIDVGAQYTTRAIRSPGKVQGDSASDAMVEAFVRDAVRLGAVLFNAGVRTSNSSLWGSAYNPSVGVVWNTNDNVRLRGSIARGFRAPSFKDMRYTFFNASAGYTIVGNDQLIPESSWSQSVALAYVPNARVGFDVEVYRNAVVNLIDTRLQGRGADGYLRYQNINVADAVTEGFETSMRLTFAHHSVTAGYTLLNAVDRETGLSLSRRSRHTARATVASSWSQLRHLTTDASVRYASRAPVIGEDAAGVPVVTEYQGAFLSVDAQARLPITSAMELSLGANNLLNQRPHLYTPAFDRQWYVGARLHWLP